MELLAALFLVGVLVGVVLAATYQPEPSEREQALRAELESLRAVSRLSLAAWQARQALREEVRRQAGRT